MLIYLRSVPISLLSIYTLTTCTVTFFLLFNCGHLSLSCIISSLSFGTVIFLHRLSSFIFCSLTLYRFSFFNLILYCGYYLVFLITGFSYFITNLFYYKYFTQYFLYLNLCTFLLINHDFSSILFKRKNLKIENAQMFIMFILEHDSQYLIIHFNLISFFVWVTFAFFPSLFLFFVFLMLRYVYVPSDIYFNLLVA